MATGGSEKCEETNLKPIYSELYSVLDDGSLLLHTLVKKNDISTCREILDTGSLDLGSQNSEGETALHVACKREADREIMAMLIEKGANVNAVNKWGQTPLHYAALYESLEKLDILLNNPQMEIKNDINGYNALHCLTYICEEDSTVWRNGIKALVKAGTDINFQTAYGQHILHIACNKLQNMNLLRYLMRNLKNLQVDRINLDGENFLHAFVMYGLDPDANEFLDELMNGDFPVCSQDMFRKLLNQRDGYGQTPFSMLLDSQEISEKILTKLINFGACVNVTDNLGNSPLHRMVALSLGNYKYVVECLLRGKANIDSANMHGESVASLVRRETVLEIFCQKQANFNSSDKWGRTPLMTVFKNDITAQFLHGLIEGGSSINATDKDGATALHYAAYHNNVEGVELLLNLGADSNIKDSLAETALDTAKRMNSVDCEQAILKAENTNVQTIYRRHKNYREILASIPDAVRLSDIERVPDIRECLNLPEQMENFLQDFFKVMFKGALNQTPEEANILAAVRNLVESICKKVASFDQRFKMSVIPTGSSVEGTKVGKPDEFDFVLCLDSLSEMCDIVPATDHNPSFACLKNKNSEIEKAYAPFFDGNGCFVPYHVLHILFRLIKKAVNEPDVWENGNLCYKFEDDVRDYTSKPVFHIKVYWNGVQYKSLMIGIDLVLGARIKGWWPESVVTDTIPLMNEEIEMEGCLLLLQTHLSDDSHLIICGMDDCINYISDFGQKDSRDTPLASKSMLRISCAPAEICLMKSFPSAVRESYALAKLITSEVLPEIVIPRRSEALCFQLIGFNVSDVEDHVVPNREISSYMLKNCVYYALDELGWGKDGPKSLENVGVIQLTTKIFEQLLKFNDEAELPAYFLKEVNVLDFEMTDIVLTSGPELLGYDLIRGHRKEMCIKLALSILRGENLMQIKEIADAKTLKVAMEELMKYDLGDIETP